MTTNRGAIAQLNTGSEILAKINTDASNKELCAGNKAYYRTSGTSGGIIVIPNMIPLRDGRSYYITTNLAASCTDAPSNKSLIFAQVWGVQLINGVFIVNAPGTGILLTQTNGGASGAIGLTKNATANTIDVTLTITLTGTANVTWTFEVEVQCSGAY